MSHTTSLNRLAFEIAARDATWPLLPRIEADLDTGEIVNATWYATVVFGYEVQEVLGRPVEMLVPEILAAQHALWRQTAAVPRTRLMGQGRQVQGRRKDGTSFPAYVLLTATAVEDRRIGVAFVVDLTGVVQQALTTSDSGRMPRPELPQGAEPDADDSRVDLS